MTTISLQFAPVGRPDDDPARRSTEARWPGLGARAAFPAFGPALGRTDSDWSVRAVCSATDPDALFVTGAAQREAAKLCSGCPVKLECLADALDNRVEYGVWGGMTERQRRALLKKSPEVTSWREVLEEARTSGVRDVAS